MQYFIQVVKNTTCLRVCNLRIIVFPFSLVHNNEIAVQGSDTPNSKLQFFSFKHSFPLENLSRRSGMQNFKV
jgi:hypothetical protein